jgi:hypothetical protein
LQVNVDLLWSSKPKNQLQYLNLNYFSIFTTKIVNMTFRTYSKKSQIRRISHYKHIHLKENPSKTQKLSRNISFHIPPFTLQRHSTLKITRKFSDKNLQLPCHKNVCKKNSAGITSLVKNSLSTKRNFLTHTFHYTF